MRFSLYVALFGASLIAAGCSIHPIQREVTGLKTVQIVQRIRCETKFAIEDKASELLASQPDARSKEIAKFLRADRRNFRNLPLSMLNERERIFYSRYIDTAIAYDFTFDIAEDNKAAVSLDPVRLITRGTAGIGLDGASGYNRSNLRRFMLSEKFGDLIYDPKLQEEQCGTAYQPENFAYPISGRVGMFELIDTFIDLNQDKELSPLDKNSPRVFADTLQFTTTIGGSVSPHAVIAPLGDIVGFGAASFTASASRTDKHSMIVGLAMGPNKGRTKDRKAVVPGFATLSGQSKSGVSPQEEAARGAITEQRLNTFYDRFGGR